MHFDLERLQIPIAMRSRPTRGVPLRVLRAEQEGTQGQDHCGTKQWGPWSDPCSDPHARMISYISGVDADDAGAVRGPYYVQHSDRNG